jgi:hypothetical protein
MNDAIMVLMAIASMSDNLELKTWVLEILKKAGGKLYKNTNFFND